MEVSGPAFGRRATHPLYNTVIRDIRSGPVTPPMFD
jgi:hypothetical protein